MVEMRNNSFMIFVKKLEDLKLIGHLNKKQRLIMARIGIKEFIKPIKVILPSY